MSEIKNVNPSNRMPSGVSRHLLASADGTKRIVVEALQAIKTCDSLLIRLSERERGGKDNLQTSFSGKPRTWSTIKKDPLINGIAKRTGFFADTLVGLSTIRDHRGQIARKPRKYS